MTSRSFRLARTSFALLAVLFFAQAFTFSQSKKMSKPYSPTRNEEYVAYCALWRTDASYRSTIRLSNQLAVTEMDVIPTIYMADGTPWELKPVHLAKSGVATVDINAMIATAPPDIQAHLSTYGSASIRYRYDWQGAVYASMSILDLVRSLDYSPAFVFPPGQGAGEKLPDASREFRDSFNGKAYEGLWFRNGHNAGGFLALTNTSTAPMSVHVKLSGLRNPNPVQKDMTLATHRTALMDLKDLFGEDDSRTGGITVSHNGAVGALQLAGGLEDLTTGYSADMPLVVAKTKQGEKADRQYASVGLMVNEQDSALGFPSGLKFWPYAFFRNLTAESRTLHFSVNYMVGKTVQNLTLPDVTLAPGEAREVAISDIAKKEPSIADINLVYIYPGEYGDVLPATGSTDASGNYVFPVRPQPVAKSGTKRSIYWLASGGFDTMYTIWNPLSISQEFLATIYYGTKGETYNLPLHMEPYASAMIDIGELMRTQLPDQNGKVIPFDAQHGMLDISHATQNPEDLITAVISGGIYNPQKATCGATCGSCVGLTQPTFAPVPIGLSVNSSRQVAFGYASGNGSQYDLTSGAQWSSNSSSIASVQTVGQSNPGLATGVTPGSTTIGAMYYGSIPENATYYCTEGSFVCPTMSQIGGSGPAPVGPTVSIVGPTNIAMLATGVQGSNSITLTANGNPSGGTFLWSVVSGQGNVTILNYDSQSAIVQSVAVGAYTVQVTYTYNGKQGIATTVGRVQQPGGLGVISNVTPTYGCGGYNTVERLIQYNVLDTSGAPLPVANMSATESFTPIFNNCSVPYPTPTIGAPTLSNGYFPAPDNLALCSSVCLPASSGGVPLGNCGITVGQTWIVNGYTVKTDTLTYTCPGPPVGAP